MTPAMSFCHQGSPVSVWFLLLPLWLSVSSLAAAAIQAEALPDPVMGTTTTVTLTGDPGDPGVTYLWRLSATPAGGNATIAQPAQRTTLVTFVATGRYRLECDRTDPNGPHLKTKTYKTKVDVIAVLTGVQVVPANVVVAGGGTQAFTVSGTDQFGASFGSLGTVTWSVVGTGSIAPNGLFTAGANTGTGVVTASVSGLSATAAVTVLGINSNPTVSAPATATPVLVTGTTTSVSVQGADDGGANILTYTWSASGPAPVVFTPNGSTLARLATATFSGAGLYTLTATIADVQGGSVTSSVGVDVKQTATTLAVMPVSATTVRHGTLTYSVLAGDQFGNEIIMPPTTWSHTGDGSIDANGLFTAGSTLGNATITAQVASLSATAQATVINGLPTVATQPSATPNPVSGTTTQLDVLGADDHGEATLTYAWTATGPTAVTIATTGTNAAKNTVATVAAPGDYLFTATITDSNGALTSATVPVSVVPTAACVVVAPAAPMLGIHGSQAFTASVRDQFSAVLAAQPALVWSATGAGTIDANGTFTAGATSGSATIIATSGTISGQSVATIVNAAPTIATVASATPNVLTGTTTVLSVLGADDGGDANLSYTWSATGPASVSVSPNGSNAAKNATATFTATGTYVFTVTVTDVEGLSVSQQLPVTVTSLGGGGPAQPPVAPTITLAITAGLTGDHQAMIAGEQHLSLIHI